MRWSPAALLAVVLVGICQAQDVPVRRGPSLGAALKPLPIYAPAGPHAGLEVDLAQLSAGSVAAILLLPELTRNVAPLVRGLDELGDSHAPLNVFTATVAFAADRTEAERRLVAASRSLRLSRPMLLALGGVAAADAWAIDPHSTATLVLAKDGVVRAVHAFTDTNREDVPRLRTMLEAVSGALPASPGDLRNAALASLPEDPELLRAHAARLALELHWRQLRMREESEDRERRAREGVGGGAERMRPRAPATDVPTGAGTEPRRGRAPTDGALRELLREALQPDLASDRLEAVFHEIEARASESAALKAEVLAMLELLVAMDRGSPALRARAEATRKRLERN